MNLKNLKERLKNILYIDIGVGRRKESTFFTQADEILNKK